MIELGPLDELSKLGEVRVRLSRVAHDERRAEDEVGDRPAQALDDFVHALASVPAAHGAEHRVGRVLKRHVDVRQDLLVLREDFDQRVMQYFIKMMKKKNNQDISALVGKVDIRKLEFHGQNDADAAFNDLKQAKDSGAFYYDDAAVVSRDAGGEVHITAAKGSTNVAYIENEEDAQ